MPVRHPHPKAVGQPPCSARERLRTLAGARYAAVIVRDKFSDVDLEPPGSRQLARASRSPDPAELARRPARAALACRGRSRRPRDRPAR